MELEQPSMTRQSHINIMNIYIDPRNGKSSPSSSSRNDLCEHSESFRKLGTGVPVAGGVSDVEKKLSWLRSQIIGGDTEFDLPFGRRRLTYADSTTSGRCVHHIEDFIVDNILPFYSSLHTSDSHVSHQTTKTVHEASSYIKRCLGGRPENTILLCGSRSTGSIKRLQEVMGIAVPSTPRERMIKCMPSEERWVEDITALSL